MEARDRAEAKPGRPGVGRAHMGPAGLGAHRHCARRSGAACRRLRTASGRALVAPNGGGGGRESNILS